MIRSFLILVALIAAHVAVRLPLFGGLGFVNADSAIFLKYDFLVLTNRLPLYPILVHMVSGFFDDPVIAGQLVAAAGCGFAAFAIYVLACELAGGPEEPGAEVAGIFACLFYSVSPFAWINGASVLAEGPFTALVCGCWAATFIFLRTRSPLSLFAAILLAGLAPLARAEGWICLLPLLLIAVRLVRKPLRLPDLLLGGLGLTGFLPVLFWHFLIVARGGYFSELGMGAGDMTPIKFGQFFLRYLLFIPLVALPQPFLAALWAGSRKRTGNAANSFGPLLLLATVLIWVVILSVHWAWDTRFLIGPSALLAALGGVGIGRLSLAGRKGWTAVLVLSTVVLGLVLFKPLMVPFSRMGSELREASSCAQSFAEGRNVWSTEIASTGYYLGKLPMNYEPSFIHQNHLVIVHDVFGGNRVDLEALSEKWELEEVCHASRKVESDTRTGAREIFQPGKPADKVGTPENMDGWLQLNSRVYLVKDHFLVD